MQTLKLLYHKIAWRYSRTYRVNWLIRSVIKGGVR
jgi:hypothetical protein